MHFLIFVEIKYARGTPQSSLKLNSGGLKEKKFYHSLIIDGLEFRSVFSTFLPRGTLVELCQYLEEPLDAKNRSKY